MYFEQNIFTKIGNNVVFCFNRIYNIFILFSKEIFRKGVILMTYADIIWKLVEKLFEEKQKETDNQSSQAKD